MIDILVTIAGVAGDILKWELATMVWRHEYDTKYITHDIFSMTMLFFTKIYTKSSSRNYTTKINVSFHWRACMRKKHRRD